MSPLPSTLTPPAASAAQKQIHKSCPTFRKKFGLMTKLLTLGLLLSVGPLLVVGGFIWYQNRQMSAMVTDSLTEIATEELDAQLRSILNQAELAEAMLRTQIEKLLGVAGDLADGAGGFSQNPAQTESWTAINQVDQTRTTIELPAFQLGDAWLGQERDFRNSVPLVDVISRMTGDTATVFQRMNERGDMLRVATSVKLPDGARAIGTYIPHDSPVIQKVLRGETFIGRAFVVDQYYATGYAPIQDDRGKVTGVLYVGTPEVRATSAIRSKLLETVIGDTGYPFVINTRGNLRGHYAISFRGERDGENIFAARDADGREFIREMVEVGEKLASGQTAEIRYSWSNPGDPVAREKIIHYTYFAPWDWLVGVGSYTEEFLAGAQQVEQGMNAIQTVIFIIIIVCAVVTGFLFFGFARRLSQSLLHVVDVLSVGSDQIQTVTGEVSNASQSLAEGANEQAASLEETSSSMETMTEMITRDSEIARDTFEYARSASKAASEGVVSVKDLRVKVDSVSQVAREMEVAMREIKSSSDSIFKIIKTIDEIAFQTNILALNAAVEAARAGEAGAGFAVVADEVRSLARRAADAARETGEMIEDSIRRSQRGVEVNASVGAHLGGVLTRATEVEGELARIADAVQHFNQTIESLQSSMTEQQTGITEINGALGQINEVTQSNAANAEEAASASEEMNAQAISLMEIVSDLTTLVKGTQEN